MGAQVDSFKNTKNGQKSHDTVTLRLEEKDTWKDEVVTIDLMQRDERRRQMVKLSPDMSLFWTQSYPVWRTGMM